MIISLKVGGGVISGTTFNRTVNNSSVTLCGGTGWDYGASITLSGKDRTNDNGDVIIRTKDNSNVSDLVLRPNGTATWGNKNLAMQEDTVPRSGGAVMTGITLGRTVEGSSFRINGGPPDGTNASLTLWGAKSSSNAGYIRIQPATSLSEMNWMFLYPNGTWTWSGTACQITSDKRFKQQITQIDNNLLDAWEDVNLVQFKYNDAVKQKGTKARLHTGYVVQQIDEACKSHNVDISEYGLYCHEEYPQETEEVEVKQDDGTIKKETKVIREASEHYSLRYTETLVVECAYLRRENNRLKERLSKIENLLNI